MAEDKITMNDVAKPGTTPALASSKPVITGHTMAVSDPMVSSAPAAEKPEPAPAPTAPTTSPSLGSMKPRIEPSKEAQEVQKEASEENDEVNATEPIKNPDETDKQVRLGELIESGEYNVNIKQKNASSNATTFITTVLVIVIVAAAAIYILADLNIIDIGIKLPFELFK